MTKTDLAFQTLRAAIEEGRYRPGEHLTLPRLLADLDMSPTPIREALRLLQAEGLLEHEAHRGVIVRRFSAERVEEVFRLRTVLEPLATELAARRATEEQLALVRALHAELTEAVTGGGVHTNSAALNAQWHRAIYDSSGSPYLKEFIARLWSALPVRAVWLTGRAKTSIAQHAEIMKALDARDAERASELMRDHVAYGALTTADHLHEIEAER